MILAFASVVEIGTALGLLIAPAFVVRWLLGGEVDDVGASLARCFGIALIALGLACWPKQRSVERGSSAVFGMLTYNAGIALYLVWLRTLDATGGLLLWPAVLLHAGVALALARAGLGRHSRA